MSRSIPRVALKHLTFDWHCLPTVSRAHTGDVAGQWWQCWIQTRFPRWIIIKTNVPCCEIISRDLSRKAKYIRKSNSASVLSWCMWLKKMCRYHFFILFLFSLFMCFSCTLKTQNHLWQQQQKQSQHCEVSWTPLHRLKTHVARAVKNIVPGPRKWVSVVTWSI